MTVQSIVELAPDRPRLHPRVAEAVAGIVAFALLSGAWLSFFVFVPFDFRLR